MEIGFKGLWEVLNKCLFSFLRNLLLKMKMNKNRVFCVNLNGNIYKGIVISILKRYRGVLLEYEGLLVWGKFLEEMNFSSFEREVKL